MSGGIERTLGAAKARQVPKAAATAKIGTADVDPLRAYTRNASDVRTSPLMAMAATLRRSKRSADDPVSGRSSSAGMNSTRPSRPRASSLSVMS